MRILDSYKTMIALLALYAVSMAIATFIEKFYGTTLAKVAVYYSPLFILLQFLMAANFVMIAFRRRLFKLKRCGVLLVHFSLIVILAGALITHIFGKEGILHLREGESSNRMMAHTNRGQSTITLPFQVELVKFTLTRYPGSMSPSSYESELLVHVDGTTRHERVYMNNVLDVKGYRFYQASYDADEAGTILSVNKDVAGRNITYTGYLLLLIGCIGCLAGKNGRIRTLNRQLQSASRHFCWIASLLAMTCSMQVVANPQREAIIPASHAERFGALPVQSANGRIMPMNTFSSEILRKLHKNNRFGQFNSDQFLLGLFVMPEMWMQIPLIIHSNEAIADYFGLPLHACAYVDFFREDGSYKLQVKLNEAYRKTPSGRTAFDKELIKLDEKVNILHQLFECQLIRIFPKTNDPTRKWYAPGEDLSGFNDQDSLFVAHIFYRYLSEVQDAVQSGDWSKPNEILDMITAYQTAKNMAHDVDKKKIDIELKYNHLKIFSRCKTGYFALGGLLLLFSFFSFFGVNPSFRWVIKFLIICILIVFHFQMMGMGMRWKIGGYAPWSNSYETMIFMAWATIFAGLLFARRSPVTLALATLFAGVILFVSNLNWMDPQINPLVPVLKSPWLMFHVAVLMAAYGFFGIGFMLGTVNLAMLTLNRRNQSATYTGSIRELNIINEIALIIGLILMTIGTFMGAVWANESWGRYWGWDPKETWALITMIIYVIVTHLHLLRKHYNLWIFNICSVLAFASVLMTYFGVNYFLSGMHAYQ